MDKDKEEPDASGFSGELSFVFGSQRPSTVGVSCFSLFPRPAAPRARLSPPQVGRTKEAQLAHSEELYQQATAAFERGEHVQAAKHARDSLSLLDSVLEGQEGEEDGSRKHPAYINLLYVVGVTSYHAHLQRGADREGELENSLSALCECLVLLRTHRGDEHENTISCARQVAKVLRERGQHAEAARVGGSCLGVMRRVLGDEHEDTLCAMIEQAEVLWEAGERDEAVTLALEHLALLERVLGEDKAPDIARTMHGLLLPLYRVKRYQEGERLAERCWPLCRQALRAEDPVALDAMHMLAVFLYHNDKDERARNTWKVCLGMYRNAMGEEAPDTLRVKHCFGVASFEAGDREGARAVLRECLEQLEDKFGASHYRVRPTREALAMVMLL